MNILRRSVVLLPAVLSACASGFQGARPLTYATPGAAHVFATADPCPHDPPGEEFGALVAAAVTGVASTLLKNFGTALAEGAKGGALPSSTATRNLQLDPGKVPKCVVVIRGAFRADAHTRPPIDLADYVDLPAAAADQRNRLKALQIPAVYRIDHYVELRLDASNNNKALTFAPVYVKLGNSIDGDTEGERDLSIALKFSRIGADPVGSTVLLADQPIGHGQSWQRQPDKRFPVEAPWFGSFQPAPAPAGTTAAAADKAVAAPVAATPLPAAVGAGGAGIGNGLVGAPGSTKPSMQSESPAAIPVTVTTTIVETRPTKEGLAFIASVFNGLEPKIEEALKPVIDDQARHAADATSLGVQADYATAEGAARAALISYCSAASSEATAAGKQDRIAKSSAARTAQLKANVAAIKAELPQPFATLVTVASGLPHTANAGPCSAQ